jgi:hypothetical protein
MKRGGALNRRNARTMLLIGGEVCGEFKTCMDTRMDREKRNRRKGGYREKTLL